MFDLDYDTRIKEVGYGEDYDARVKVAEYDEDYDRRVKVVEYGEDYDLRVKVVGYGEDYDFRVQVVNPRMPTYNMPSWDKQSWGGQQSDYKKRLEDAHHGYLVHNRPAWAERAGILPPDPKKGCEPVAMMFLFVVLSISGITVMLVR